MKTLGLIFIGLASGIAIAGGVFAFIAAIGLVPRMAQRTRTEGYIRIYEDAILLGGLCGCIFMLVDIRLHIPLLFIGLYALLCGIFVGVLASALAEVLNVMPILMRRMRLRRGIIWFTVSFAIGKLVGALAYFVLDGFYRM